MRTVTAQKSAAAVVGARESGCPRAKQRDTRSRRANLDPIVHARTGQMRAAASTPRALEQDEVTTTTTDDLLEHVLASDNLARAWKRVKANRGAPGIDGMTIEDFPAHARAHWPAVRQQIRQGRYAPQAVRRVDIPKPGGGQSWPRKTEQSDEGGHCSRGRGNRP